MKLADTIKKRAQQLEIAVISILVVTIAFTLGQNGLSGITGFVASETHRQPVSITTTTTSAYDLYTTNGTPRLTHFSVTGKITGNGSVTIYLENGNKQRALIHTNTKPLTSGSLSAITGALTEAPQNDASDADSGILIIGPPVKRDDTITVPPGHVTQPGTFDDRCTETCVLDPLYSTNGLILIIILDPDTTLDITSITYTQG